MRTGTGLLCVAMVAAPGSAGAQSYRARLDLRAQAASFRGVSIDSVLAAQLILGAGGSLTTAQGFAARCPGINAYCQFFRPGPIQRGVALTEQYLPPQVPAGLPAALLERRPDVVEAEQLLVAANANVGAAKALFFPTISLTGLLGTLSGEFSNLLKADSNVWSANPGLFQPLFQGGRIRRNYEATKARFDQALAQYQKAALSGYREVADSVVTIQKLAERRVEQEKGVLALRDATQLSRDRYDSGLANYLEILIADQQLFAQELELARTRGAELRALVELYRALGGGWQPEQGSFSSPGPPSGR